MINIYKEIPSAFVSMKPFKLYKTNEFDQTNIGTGSTDILIFDAIGDTSSSSEYTPLYKPIGEYTYDNAGYIIDYNYLLANGDKYMPVSESLNPNGSVKRLIYQHIKRLFYEPTSVFYDKSFCTMTSSGQPLQNNAFMFYIPSVYLGESIEQGTFSLLDTSDVSSQPYGSINPAGLSIYDDNGILYDENNTMISYPIGNISYDTGHIIFTDEQYRNYFLKNLIETSSNANFTLSVTSYYTTTEHEYVCVAGADEFNMSMNPTLFNEPVSGSTQLTGTVKTELVTNNAFRTHITSIGLYDDIGGLVAVAKFAKPIRKQKTLDSVFIVKFDM